jgi:hypothetical protein
MIYKTVEEVNLLVNRFEERTLPKTEWTHAAHLTVGLYYCFHYPFGTAKNLMSDGIYWLNDAHGTPNTETSGYHETLTVFWLKTIAAFISENKEEKSLVVLANNLLAVCNDTKLPLKYYSRELLFSTEARLNYVEPDLEKFPLAMNGLTFALHNLF